MNNVTHSMTHTCYYFYMVNDYLENINCNHNNQELPMYFFCNNSLIFIYVRKRFPEIIADLIKPFW